MTVLADAVTGQTNDNGNAEVTATQRYDTLAPAAPGINIVATDDIINRAEQTTTDLTGTNEAGATITLCFGGTNAACDGGGTSRTAADNVTVTGTTWSYTLIAADIAAMDQGPETLRATATDAAGNPAQATRAIFVDTVAPFFRSGITGEVAAHTNIEVIIYDANATNNRGDSENADDDITYTLPLTPDGGDNPNLFNIDEDSGVVRYNERPDQRDRRHPSQHHHHCHRQGRQPLHTAARGNLGAGQARGDYYRQRHQRIHQRRCHLHLQFPRRD